jgi:hypothetical protein
MALLDLSRHADEGPDRVGWERGGRSTRGFLAYGDAFRTSEYFLVVRGLELAGTAMTMRVRGRKLSATDGPFAETKERLGGSIVIDIGSRLGLPRAAPRAWPSRRGRRLPRRPASPPGPALAGDAAPAALLQSKAQTARPWRSSSVTGTPAAARSSRARSLTPRGARGRIRGSAGGRRPGAEPPRATSARC